MDCEIMLVELFGEEGYRVAVVFCVWVVVMESLVFEDWLAWMQ